MSETLIVAVAALNLGFLIGRLFERLDYARKEKR